MKDFENWLMEFEYFDISDVIKEVVEEATNATFRGEETSESK